MPYLLFNILVDLHNFLMRLGGWQDYFEMNLRNRTSLQTISKTFLRQQANSENSNSNSRILNEF